MAENVTVGEELEHRILDLVRMGDSVAVESLRVLTHAIEPMTPAIRSMTPPVVYDFTRQLATIQRKFAADVLQLTEAIIPAASLPA